MMHMMQQSLSPHLPPHDPEQWRSLPAASASVAAYVESLNGRHNVNYIHIVTGKVCKSTIETRYYQCTLVAKRFSPEAVKNTDLHKLVASGNPGAVRAYLQTDKSQVNTQNEYGWTPMHVAAENGSKEMCQVLFEHGAHPDTPNVRFQNQPLHVASRNGHLNVCQYLVRTCKVSVDVGPRMVKGVGVALANHHIHVVKWFLSEGCDVTTTSYRGDSVEILTLLLEAGADPNHDYGEDHKQGPLFYAAAKGLLENCKILLEYGACPFKRDVKGYTALDHALSAGHVEVFRMLLAKMWSTRVPFVLRPESNYGLTINAWPLIQKVFLVPSPTLKYATYYFDVVDTILDVYLKTVGSFDDLFHIFNGQYRYAGHAEYRYADRVGGNCPSLVLRLLMHKGWKVSLDHPSLFTQVSANLLRELTEHRTHALVARGLCQRLPVTAVCQSLEYVYGATLPMVRDWLSDVRVTTQSPPCWRPLRMLVSPTLAASITPTVTRLSLRSLLRLRKDVQKMYAVATEGDGCPLLIQYCQFVWNAYELD